MNNINIQAEAVDQKHSIEIKFINIISNYSLLELALSILQNVFLPVRMDQYVSTIIPASVLHTGPETL